MLSPQVPWPLLTVTWPDSAAQLQPASHSARLPAASGLLLAAAAGAYFMLSYGIVIDSTMLVSALQTDVHETQDLLNWRLPATVLAQAAGRVPGCCGAWALGHHPKMPCRNQR